MMKKKQSFAETRPMRFTVALRPLGIAMADACVADCYCYLRPLRQIAGKGGQFWIILICLGMLLTPSQQAHAAIDCSWNCLSSQIAK